MDAFMETTVKRYSVEMDGQVVSVVAEKINGVLWFHYNGQTYAVEPTLSSRSTTRGKEGKAQGDLKAPMPGKIVAVMAKVGAQVEARTALVVMEAMKMEYTLESASACEVNQVMCQVGDQVQMGQVLVKLEANSP